MRKLWRRVTRVTLSDWLALAGKNPGVFNPPAIERPSFGRGCNGLRKFMRVVVENWLTVRGRFCKDAGVMVHARGARTY